MTMLQVDGQRKQESTSLYAEPSIFAAQSMVSEAYFTAGPKVGAPAAAGGDCLA